MNLLTAGGPRVEAWKSGWKRISSAVAEEDRDFGKICGPRRRPKGGGDVSRGEEGSDGGSPMDGGGLGSDEAKTDPIGSRLVG